MTTSTNDVNIAFTNDNVSRVMGFFHAPNAKVRVRRTTSLVGSLAAKQVCWSGYLPTCGYSNGHFPRFTQGTFLDWRLIPQELFGVSGASGDRWALSVLPRFWTECRRIRRVGGADATPLADLPTVPTGICGYQ